MLSSRDIAQKIGEARMARKTLKERRAKALAELEAAKQNLAKLEESAAERIGRLAIRSGLVDLDLTEDQISAEFGAIAERFQRKQGASAQGAAAIGKS